MGLCIGEGHAVMAKRLWAGGVVFGALVLVGGDVSACGDKLIALGRGVRFQLAIASQRPGSILIYVSKNVKDSQLPAVLKFAGHKVQTTADSSKVTQTLASAKYDVLLADVADAEVLMRQIQAAASKPVFLPVMYKPSQSELAAAIKQYTIVLKTPSNIVDFLTTIDQAIKLRASSHKQS